MSVSTLILHFLGLLARVDRSRDVVALVAGTGMGVARQVGKGEEGKDTIEDFTRTHYVVQLQHNDLLHFLYHPNKGVLARLGLCPQFVQVFSVSESNISLLGGSYLDASKIPCLCGLSSAEIAKKLLIAETLELERQHAEIAKISQIEQDEEGSIIQMEIVKENISPPNCKENVEVVTHTTETSNNALEKKDFKIPRITSEVVESLTINHLNHIPFTFYTPIEMFSAVEHHLPRARDNIDTFWNEKLQTFIVNAHEKQVECNALMETNAQLVKEIEAEKFVSSKLMNRLDTLEKQILKMTRPLLPLSNS